MEGWKAAELGVFDLPWREAAQLVLFYFPELGVCVSPSMEGGRLPRVVLDYWGGKCSDPSLTVCLILILWL